MTTIETAANIVIFLLQLMASNLDISSGIQFPAQVSSSPRNRRQSDELNANITIPSEILENALQTGDATGIVFILYTSSSLFPLRLTNRSIATSIIGARFTEESANFDLVENVTITFQLSTPVSVTSLYTIVEFLFNLSKTVINVL